MVGLPRDSIEVPESSKTIQNKNIFCRDKQLGEIIVFIRDTIINQTSRCMYVSGVPGTGKTVVVQAAVDELKNKHKFRYLYVNGLTLGQRPEKLWKKMNKGLLGGGKQTPKQALAKLCDHFETKDILPTVLVVDELDQLMDKSQSVLYRLLEWTTNPTAKFTFIAIFNTMNLPESALVNRNASRMGFARVVFPPYDHAQLREIVEKSLLQNADKSTSGLGGDALTLLSRKVAAISGDARRALEIAKRTLEILENSDSSKKGTLAVDEAFKELFSSPKIDTIRDCSTLEKTILSAISSELNRTGLEETNLAPVQHSILEANSFEGMNVSIDNIIAALTRLAALKLVIVETTLPFFYSQTKLSMNVPLEDVRYALGRSND